MINLSIEFSYLNNLLNKLNIILFAVPKQKISNTAKKTRNSSKFLKNSNYTTCTKCGTPKIQSHLCHNCYQSLKKDC